MPIDPLLPFNDGTPPEPIPTNDDMPKGDMEIYFRDINAFIPEGKTFDQLTPEEQEIIKNKVRFDPYKPSQYQGITGFGNMV